MANIGPQRADISLGLLGSCADVGLAVQARKARAAAAEMTSATVGRPGNRQPAKPKQKPSHACCEILSSAKQETQDEVLPCNFPCCRIVSWVDEGMGPWPRSRGPGCPRRLREAQHGEQVVWRPRPRPRWRKRRKVCHRNPRCGGPAAGWTRGQSAPTANPSLRLSAELRSSDQPACACIACVGGCPAPRHLRHTVTRVATPSSPPSFARLVRNPTR